MRIHVPVGGGGFIQSKQEVSSLQLCFKIDQTGGILLPRYSRSDYTHPLVHHGILTHIPLFIMVYSQT